MTEIKKESGGSVRIADEVLIKIAGTAAMEVDGVAGLANGYFTDKDKAAHKQFKGITAAVQKAMYKQPASKGIAVTVNGQTASFNMALIVRMGAKVHEVTAEVQRRVKSAVETMTGLDVYEVNIYVGAITGPGSNKR